MAARNTPESVAEFHATRAGVRGLVESGVASVPAFFLAPSSSNKSLPDVETTLEVPTVDLSGPRSAAVSAAGAAARTCGLFYVTEHGVQVGAAVSAVRAFHELPRAVRSAFYTPASSADGVTYSTVPYTRGRYDGRHLCWRDYLRLLLQGPPTPDLGRIPAVCRDALVEYRRRLEELGKEISGLLWEALGVAAERLLLMPVEGWAMTGHYYPPCPEPERVVGAMEHTDPSIFTVLAQDHVGGLQVRLDDGSGGWADVPPVPGALLVNIGDVLKLVSNGQYKSVEHRVRIKSCVHARVSIATFFNPAKRGDSQSQWLGPLPELLTPENPAIYRSFSMAEFMNSRAEFGHGSSSTDHFRVAVE